VSWESRMQGMHKNIVVEATRGSITWKTRRIALRWVSGMYVMKVECALKCYMNVP
jgi:hypothetical protein